MVFFEDQTIQDIKSEKPKQKVVRDSNPIVESNPGGDTHEMEQPHQTMPPDETNEDGVEDNVPMEHDPQVRRSTRNRQPSRRYFSDEFVNFTDEGEPQSFVEAIETDDKEKWIQAIMAIRRGGQQIISTGRTLFRLFFA